MLLTVKMSSAATAADASVFRSARSVTAGAGGWPPPPASESRLQPASVGQASGADLLLRRILGGGVLHHRGDDIFVRLVPVGGDLPVRAVPRLDAACAGALVVRAGHLDRLEDALEAELLDAIRAWIEVFQAPADLLAVQWLVAEPRLRGADRLDAEHAVDETAHVQDFAGLVELRCRALALVVDELLEVFVQLELAGGVLQRDRVVALGAVLGRAHVRLGAGPPHAIHLLARVADRNGLLDGRRVHYAPPPQHQMAGTVLTHRQPGRLLLHAGMGDGQQQRLEAVHAGAFLQERDRLLAVGRVVVDERDLLALELVPAAFLLGNVLEDHVSGAPV